MTNKNCPVCGKSARENNELSTRPLASCDNPHCFMYATGFHVEDWNAPRPVEDALRDEITDAKNSFAVAKNIINALEYECDNHIKNLAQIRAELEAIKARRCETCKHGRIRGNEEFEIIYCEENPAFYEHWFHDCCINWEAKEAQTATSTETSDK